MTRILSTRMLIKILITIFWQEFCHKGMYYWQILLYQQILLYRQIPLWGKLVGRNLVEDSVGIGKSGKDSVLLYWQIPNGFCCTDRFPTNSVVLTDSVIPTDSVVSKDFVVDKFFVPKDFVVDKFFCTKRFCCRQILLYQKILLYWVIVNTINI